MIRVGDRGDRSDELDGDHHTSGRTRDGGLSWVDRSRAGVIIAGGVEEGGSVRVAEIEHHYESHLLFFVS